MTNEKVLSGLRSCVKIECEECPFYDEDPASVACGSEMMNAAAELIEKLTDRCARYAEEIAVAQERTRWVPVEERLPENGDVVLCWYEYFRFGEYNRMYRTYGIGYYIHGMWGGDVSNGRGVKVLAWIPLPEPPEVE